MLNGAGVVQPQGVGCALEGGTTARAGDGQQECCKAHDRLARLVRRFYFAQGVTNGDVRAAAFSFLSEVMFRMNGMSRVQGFARAMMCVRI